MSGRWTLQDIDRETLEALAERYGPEELIKLLEDYKASLRRLAERKFERLKLEVDELLPCVIAPDETLAAPRFNTIVAAFAKLLPDLSEESHRKYARRYQRYRRQAGAKTLISASTSALIG